MRLLLCIPYFSPAYAFGGSVTVAETIVEGLIAAGYEVSVATTDVLNENERVKPDTRDLTGAEVIRFPNVSHRAAAAHNAYAPRGYRQWLRRNIGRFDVVLLHDVYSVMSVGGARAAQAADVPFVLQPLGTLSPAPERGRPLVKRAFLRAWGFRTVREAAALIYSTDFERRDMLQAGAVPGQLVRMPLPLDLPEHAPVNKASVATVVSVGRLHPIKRLDRLLDAAAIARQDVPGLRLDIVGPGTEVSDALRRQARALGIEDAVELHGFVSRDEKLELTRRAHVGALLSASEGLPMAALEYMACGLPVILSRGCHLPEIDDRAGIVVEGSAESAAAAMRSLLTDEALRARLSAGALEFAADFRRETVIPRMIRALEEIQRG